MQKKNPYIYYFIKQYNIDELTNLQKNINLIFRNYNKNLDINAIKSIQQFCKINKRNFYLSNNVRLALKLGLKGVYIPSFNKNINFATKYSLPNKFEIIGSAHNSIQIRNKEKQYSNKDLINEGFDKDLVKEISNKITINEYKRRQAPIGIRVSKKAFGAGRRFPIINHFREDVK